MEGCYTATGTKCSANPNALCNLQIVPAGRCSYGDLAGGLNSCVWPHRAGRCNGNIKVGCLTGGATGECSGLVPNTCDLTIDKFGRAADPNDAATCTCTNATSTTVCAGSLAVCSDGDLTRDFGGNGVALGVELKLGGPGSQTYAGMGPAITGSTGKPDSTPGYALENPPVNFDPQRDAGSVGRTPAQGTGLVHQARATDAREITNYTHPTIANPGPGPLNVRKVKAFGDSYWGDWVFISVAVTGTFNTHIVTYTCDPPVGWIVGTAVNGAGNQCYEASRDALSFLWLDDLTAAQKTAYTVGGVPVCPPHCYKDFNLSTMESEQLALTGLDDPNAGIQLAMQSGEPVLGRVAGARDTMGVAVITSLTYLVDNDLRCKMGGWGNAPGLVGRCVDGPRVCAPGTAGDATCAVAPRQDGVPSGPAQGGSCRACNGPFDAGTNPLGLPIGYNTHGRAELDLVAGERIGGIAGQNADVRVPLFVVGTTGNATADFRDISGQGLPDVDLSDMGPVDPGSSFAPGIGAGGTFVNGTALNIGEPCCGTGAGVNVSWAAAALGTITSGFENGFSYRYGPGGGEVFLSDWALTYDKGPGPDGIPGCIGDNVNTVNGAAACDQRLGFGSPGSKTNSFFATGQDDRAIRYTVGASLRPASGPKFQWRDADASVVAYFGSTQNPPTSNTIAAFTLRDLNVFVDRSADVLVKAQTTQCPLTNTGPVCALDPCQFLGGDVDGDGICGNSDKCPTVADPGQADIGETTAVPPAVADGVGDACDNCVKVNNPIVPGGATAFLAANPWATLTGGQRDDDHDGYGNICDGDFPGVSAGSVTAADTAQYKASIGDPKSALSCGTANNRPCAYFDLNSANSTESSAGGIGPADTSRYKLLIGTVPGPRCPACTGTGSVPLPCQAGTAGSC